eukprot:7390491-Prymnesium_polylepis.1
MQEDVSLHRIWPRAALLTLSSNGSRRYTDAVGASMLQMLTSRSMLALEESSGTSRRAAHLALDGNTSADVEPVLGTSPPSDAETAAKRVRLLSWQRLQVGICTLAVSVLLWLLNSCTRCRCGERNTLPPWDPVKHYAAVLNQRPRTLAAVALIAIAVPTLLQLTAGVPYIDLSPSSFRVVSGRYTDRADAFNLMSADSHPLKHALAPPSAVCWGAQAEPCPTGWRHVRGYVGRRALLCYELAEWQAGAVLGLDEGQKCSTLSPQQSF